MKLEEEAISALAALKEATRDARAPARVEAALAAAFREHAAAARRKPWRGALGQCLAGALATAAAVAMLLVPPPAAAPRSEQDDAGWYSLRYGAPPEPGEVAPVVRTSVPRIVLSSLGVPVDPELAGEMIQAEVVIGWDGAARAIRFVR